ncbi:MAG: YabP/YqfC family sporulation protein [Bacillota bacterium]|nr:YabP/YqfC family sporulation protein [Bacillota bacterium]
MIDIKDELLLDFSVNRSRILITEKLVLIDNVMRIVDFSDTVLTAQTGKNSFTTVNGTEILISSFQNSRIVCSGEIKTVEFHNKGKDIG